MNTTILTEGGIKIGLGHISRCLSLAEALTEKKYQCNFYIKTKKTTDFNLDFNHELFDWQKNKKKIFDKTIESEIVIIDSYSAPEKFYYEIYNLNKNCLFFDDFNRINYPPCILVNPAQDNESYNHPNKNHIKFLLGPKYQALQKSFWDVVPSKKNKQIKEILITFGGDDLRNITPQTINFLEKEFPFLKKTVVIGSGFSNIEQYENYNLENTEIIYHPTSGQMCQLILKSDLVICGGGQTLFELARLKTPALIIGIAKNQENNIEFWQTKPFYKFVGWWNVSNIIGRLKHYLINFQTDFSKISEEIYKSPLLVDGQGSRRIVKEIFNYVRKK
jgi:UDP-2,4-diacetamido-2,4,6-trideoxy-beta-L-altropyranose hydrolase